MSSFYENSKTIYLEDIKDGDIIKKYDANENLSIDYDNVEFDFPNIEDYKYSCIDPEVLSLCTTRTYDRFLDVWSVLDSEFDQRYVYHTKDYNLDFVGVEVNGFHRQRIVNRFSAVKNNPNGDTTSLKIIPAEIYAGVSGVSNESFTNGAFTAAYARNNNAIDETSTQTGLNELIKEGVPEEEAPDKIYVALYMGYQGLFVGAGDPTIQYRDYKLPMSATDTYYYINTDNFNYLLKFQDEELTLQLSGSKGLYDTFYKNNLKIDTRTEYQFSFLANQIYDPKSIFLIRNKRYFCKELHYRIGMNGLNNLIEGTFYLIE